MKARGSRCLRMPTIRVRNSPHFCLEGVFSGVFMLSGSLFVLGFSSSLSDGWGFIDATLGELALPVVTLLDCGVSFSKDSCFSPSGLVVASVTSLWSSVISMSKVAQND